MCNLRTRARSLPHSPGELHQLLRVAGFTGIDDTKALAEGRQVTVFADAGEHSLADLVRHMGPRPS
ncbi:hypothetical protein GCM10010277_73380 [Streptomyces longisporoflavus]|uniref:hypothetical protein n=1 Tax=Streptomyces longisporoflavus TaxID=28044 RepID=UPI00167E6F7E|nr:hypothetical protein [Streptomyces longisporoflavus]GGV65932.1 hypothetical protein GCM10010277_73380 [Streptomyces longisporoflavus]